MTTATIRAVPSMYRNGGWDVVHDEPDGTITEMARGLKMQQAHDMAKRLNCTAARTLAEWAQILDCTPERAAKAIDILIAKGLICETPVTDPEDERVARFFAEPEE